MKILRMKNKSGGMMDKESQQKYDKLIECLINVYNSHKDQILLILIFGSSAKKEGVIIKESDVDILIVFKDNADTYRISNIIDSCLSEIDIIYDYGWYKITQLNDMIKRGEDYYPLYNIFNFSKLICGDEKVLNDIRYKLSLLNPIKAAYNTMILGLDENRILKQAIIRKLRVLLVSSLLIDFIERKRYVPNYEEIIKWALSPASTLNDGEKEILRYMMETIKYRKEISLISLEKIEKFVFKKVLEKKKKVERKFL